MDESNGYCDEIFNKSEHYESLKYLMKHIRDLSEIDKKRNNVVLNLKLLCRYKIRKLISEEKLILVQIDNQFGLNSQLLKFVKFMI